MKINSIDIVNFRGFQHETREFKTNLTVVIGNNTAGKTTLLKALQVGLGAIPALSESDFDHGEIEAIVTVTGHQPSRHHFSYMSDGLQSTIQFIVSTHNPFIVQSLQKDQLISFDDDVLTEGEPYRESLEDITSDRMGLKQDIRSQR